MPSTEHIQRQIHSLEELGAIVRTMKALSAASIRQYEKAVLALDEYNRTVELALMAVLPQTGALNYSAPRRASPPALTPRAPAGQALALPTHECQTAFR